MPIFAPMQTIVKSFRELSVDELYDILLLRARVFVVEQDCVYNDIDGLDKDAIHVFIKEGDDTVGCLRVFKRNEDTVQIGRVVTSPEKRGTGLGAVLMSEAVKIAKENFPRLKMYLEAQMYAIGFYQKFGFNVASEEFLEDGIPHVVMTRES